MEQETWVVTITVDGKEINDLAAEAIVHHFESVVGKYGVISAVAERLATKKLSETTIAK